MGTEKNSRKEPDLTGKNELEFDSRGEVRKGSDLSQSRYRDYDENE